MLGDILKVTAKFDGVTVSADFPADRQELRNYFDYVKARIAHFDSIHVHLNDDDTVDIDWTRRNQSFERIRRITGYLVGDIDRWNDAKKSEEKDRVKHDARI